MSAYGPSFTAAKLYRKQSSKGATYFAGRMGGVKIALLKSKEAADDGGEIWHLVFSEAQPYQPRGDNTEARARSQEPAQRQQRSAPDTRSYPIDDADPFPGMGR